MKWFRSVRHYVWLAPLVLGVIFVAAGIYTYLEGRDAKNTVHDQIVAEQITTSPDSSIPGVLVDDADTAQAQADVIREHSLKISGGKTYSQLDRFVAADGAGTSDAKAALIGSDGNPDVQLPTPYLHVLLFSCPNRSTLEEPSMMPLEGIRILDLTRLAPGPFCTMLLGDLGADVIVVEEPPGVGRRFDIGMSERAQAFNALGRNKRSVGLNLKDRGAQEAFLRMAEKADIVLEGFRPGVVKRLGVDYETVSARNPRIIYCSLSGYGQTGPYAQLVGHDINYISVGGALGAIGWPGTPPAIPLNLIADFAGGGLYAAFAILAAVIAREKTGRGQWVDMAMSDGVTSLLASTVSMYFSAGAVPKPGVEFLNGGIPPYCVYETSDGKWLSIGCLEPWFWAELCRALGCEEYIPHQNNREKSDEIFEFLRRRFKEKTRDAWFEELRQHDICVGPVYSMDEVFADPHVQARGMIAEVQHAEFGKVKQVGVGPKFSETPGGVRSTSPKRGAHTEELLREAGYTAAEVEEMKMAGVAG